MRILIAVCLMALAALGAELAPRMQRDIVHVTVGTNSYELLFDFNPDAPQVEVSFATNMVQVPTNRVRLIDGKEVKHPTMARVPQVETNRVTWYPAEVLVWCNDERIGTNIVARRRANPHPAYLQWLIWAAWEAE